jgi:hypothetical protein
MKQQRQSVNEPDIIAKPFKIYAQKSKKYAQFFEKQSMRHWKAQLETTNQ